MRATEHQRDQMIDLVAPTLPRRDAVAGEDPPSGAPTDAPALPDLAGGDSRVRQVAADDYTRLTK